MANLDEMKKRAAREKRENDAAARLMGFDSWNDVLNEWLRLCAAINDRNPASFATLRAMRRAVVLLDAKIDADNAERLLAELREHEPKQKAQP